MASITVHIDLYVFDLDEILEELKKRYNSSRNREKNQKQINNFIKRMKIDCEEDFEIKIKTLTDEMKIDFLKNNLDKIKLSDLQNLI